MKSQILILGAGLVAGPMIKYFIKHQIFFTVADLDTTKALNIIGSSSFGKTIVLDVNNQEELSNLISEHELIVSLLPYTFHVKIAALCLLHKKMLVTTSYISKEMADLDAKAKENGLIFLNECGLDPGIDHMSVMQLRDRLTNIGYTINEVYSYCGALPSPESADNPFKYKFSWSPKGVLLAGNNDARFKKDNEFIEIKTENLFKNAEQVDFNQLGKLEVYPNRDSISYLETYNLQDCQTLIRGTFRYPGWCEIMDVFKQLNLTQTTQLKPVETTLRGVLASCIGIEETSDIVNEVRKLIQANNSKSVINALDYLGLFSEAEIILNGESPLDILAKLMIDRMMLQPEERDLVVMQHIFKVTSPENLKKTFISRLVEYGNPNGDTAIAKTVAIPAAIASKLILEKRIDLTGVVRPIYPELYNPILEELETEGIKLIESN
mgnify:FL=1